MAQSISQEAVVNTGLPGATAASRYAGATTSGAPTTGTFAVGDFIVDQSGAMYVCTVAGTPGTWGIVGGNSLVSNVAGRNKIINGDFGIWQRGTTFNNIGNNVYNADRWITSNGNSSATINITRQSFTPGSAPVVGYESAYYLQFAQTVAGSGSGYNQLQNRIEDVRTFANQTVTFSFWALAGSGTININPIVGQCFGSGGSGNVELTLTPTSISVGSSGWVRYTATGTLPSIAGKTIGTGNYIYAYFGLPTNAVFTFNVWGVQLEAGSTATEFTTASGSIGGELALCQRYYQSTYPLGVAPGSTSSNLWTMIEMSETNRVLLPYEFPVQMRTSPTMTAYSPQTGTVNKWYNRSTASDVTVSSFAAGPAQVFYNTLSAGQTAGNQMLVNFTASAEL